MEREKERENTYWPTYGFFWHGTRKNTTTIPPSIGPRELLYGAYYGWTWNMDDVEAVLSSFVTCSFFSWRNIKHTSNKRFVFTRSVNRDVCKTRKLHLPCSLTIFCVVNKRDQKNFFCVLVCWPKDDDLREMMSGDANYIIASFCRSLEVPAEGTKILKVLNANRKIRQSIYGCKISKRPVAIFSPRPILSYLPYLLVNPLNLYGYAHLSLNLELVR